jgi:branched-chain amino acid transport system substrate-binding protein
MMLSSVRIGVPLLVLALLAGCNRGGEPEPLLIGHVVPGGPEKSTRKQVEEALLLAVEDINKEENRIAGHRVQVLHVDPHDKLDLTASEAERSMQLNETLQAEAARLCRLNGVVALLGGSDLNQAERQGRAALPYEVALLTPVALPPRSLSDNIFSLNSGLAFQGRVLARFATEELKADRVGVLLDSRRLAADALASAFTREFSLQRGTHVEEQTYKNDTELSEASARLVKAGIKALLYTGTVADWDKVRGKLQAPAWNGAILFGSDSPATAALMSNSESSNIYLATAYVASGGLAAAQDFASTFQKRFSEPPDAVAALAYDSIRMVVEALRRAKPLQPGKVRAELSGFTETPFDSLAGPLTLDKYHAARRPLAVMQLSGGQVVVKKSYDPEGK